MTAPGPENRRAAISVDWVALTPRPRRGSSVGHVAAVSATNYAAAPTRPVFVFHTGHTPLNKAAAKGHAPVPRGRLRRDGRGDAAIRGAASGAAATPRSAEPRPGPRRRREIHPSFSFAATPRLIVRRTNAASRARDRRDLAGRHGRLSARHRGPVVAARARRHGPDCGGRCVRRGVSYPRGAITRRRAGGATRARLELIVLLYTVFENPGRAVSPVRRARR